MIVLGDVPVVKIGNPKVKDYIEKEGKIKDDEIKSIIAHPHDALHGKVNPKNPERFYEKIQEEK